MKVTKSRMRGLKRDRFDRHITSLHGEDAVKAELDALHMARGPVLKPVAT